MEMINDDATLPMYYCRTKI